MDMPHRKSRLYQIPKKQNPGEEKVGNSDDRRGQGKLSGLSKDGPGSREEGERSGAGVWSNEDRQKRPVRHSDDRGHDIHNPRRQVRNGRKGNASSRNREVESDDNLSPESVPPHSSLPAHNDDNEEDRVQEESTKGRPVLRTDRRDALGLVDIHPFDDRRLADHDEKASAADEVPEYLPARPRADRASKEDSRWKKDGDRTMKSSPSPSRTRHAADEGETRRSYYSRAPSSTRRSPSPDFASSKKSASPDITEMDDRSRDQHSDVRKSQEAFSKKGISPPAVHELGSSSL